MTRESMVFYRSFVEGIAELDEKDQLEAFWNIVNYALDGKEPEGKGAAKAIFKMAKPQIDKEIISADNKLARNCIEYKKWRSSVLNRDNFACQICGKIGGTLNAHHIKHFATHPELRFDIDNGLTLCESCHREVHRNERKLCSL